MSRKPYTPRPDSLPARVIDELTDGNSGGLSCADIQQKFGVPSRNVRPTLAAAVKHGALVMGKVEGLVVYMLPDGANQAAADSAPPTTAPRKARRGQAGRDRANATRRVRAQVVEPPPAPGPVACLWDDGDIVLHGLTPNADGSTATITQEHARRLHGFLHRLFGPAELVATYPAPAPRGPLLTHDGR